ncbi:MAG: hypothetical protein PHV53_10425 [Fermentimonas sp.]|nr:hypothetical protein [Fermentimonas sp.]
MFKVTSEIQKKLLALPESGMGYQIVDATYSDHRIKETIILNSTLAEPTEGRIAESILKSMLNENTAYLMRSAVESKEIIDVKLKSGKGIFETRAFSEGAKRESKGANEAPEEQTKQEEYFIRFSHFEDDKRIDKENKSVLPGTYATTLQDANYCIAQKIDPIARYALPNTLKIEYKFHIVPEEKTLIKRGVVQPAYGQLGGGVEVIFTKGTDKSAVILVEKINT